MGKLKEEFFDNDKVRTYKLQTLRRNYENLKMEDLETIKDYCSRVFEIVSTKSLCR